MAQSLYFFRDLRRLAAQKFRMGLTDERGWQRDLVRHVLDDIRGVPFGYFANKKAEMEYSASSGETWRLSVYWGNRRVTVDRTLSRRLRQWAAEWQRSPTTLLFGDHGFQVFLTTERSALTRLINENPAAMFQAFHTEPFRWFATALQVAGQLYDAERKRIVRPPTVTDTEANPWQRLAATMMRARKQVRWERLTQICRTSLLGEAYLPTAGVRKWKWKAYDGKGHPVRRADGREVILPVEATSSGQSEAWPIFLLAITFGGAQTTFYIEEPESHLHPAAQVALLDLMVYLIEEGCRFVVTTHSPFLLYKLNNYLQAFKNRQEGRADAPTLDPKRVSAYLFAGGTAHPLMDPETGLIDVSDLDDVAAGLGQEFERLLG